ncbi:MAG TPA: hypothetical protein VKF60_07285 [Myxococcota bacterium]|nr:hypothetical protein [Myxococcota bacterium]
MTQYNPQPEWILGNGVPTMAKKKTAKRTGKKATSARKPAPKKSGTAAPVDPIAAALARRRLAMLSR